jgi:hypothetical protein
VAAPRDLTPVWSGNQFSVITHWGSMAWDPNSQQLYFFGGGHAQYERNEVYAFGGGGLS